MKFTGSIRRSASLHTSALLVAGALLFSPFNRLGSQSSRGTVTGLVVDATKAAVGNATVDLNNEDTKVTRSTNTNESGIYRFDAVDPGNYTVKVTAPGFKVLTVAPFPVRAAQVASVDGQLELGSVNSTVEVSSEAALIQTEAPVRGGTITTKNLVNLPIATQNPVSLTLTLPGVTTNRYGFGVSTFSVNGARGRSNNFLIDGTENNDISVAGQAFQITNPDAVQEVSAQTGNFDAEYGRAGGAVVNTITRSGTNEFHGSLRYLLDSTFDDALTNLQKLDTNQLQRGHPSPGTDQYFSGTVGGPVIKNKTFFFSAYQEERQVSTSTTQLTSLSAAGRAALLAAFPTNPRVALLNQVTTGADATVQLFRVPTGPAGSGRPNIEFGTYNRAYANTYRDRQLLERVDHTFSNSDQISVRYLYDDNLSPNYAVSFVGFDTPFQNTVNSALINETHTFSPTVTNELRLGYNRIYYYFPFAATSPLAANIPTYTIAGFTSGSITLGVSGNYPQGRIANNYEIQDTISYVSGKHSFRAGISLLDQRAKQAAPFNIRGSLSYQTSTGYTGFANFIDNYGGSNGSVGRDFGSASYYPSLIRQAYFLQDRWRATAALTVTLGVRYEFFGNPINSLRTPAYTGLFNVDPVTFQGPYSQPNHVNSDLNNWSPTIGLAYSPSGSGPFGIFGDKKTVFRGGFQMGYDSFFNNIASNAVASAPNNIVTSVPSVTSTTSPRGLANLSDNFPQTGIFSALSSQTLVPRNLVNPYYMRWSGGFQRELPGKFVLDASYVGTRGRELFVNEDLNPLVTPSLQHFPAGYSAANLPASRLQQRYDPLQGSRLIRTNGGDSIYHAAQLNISRRYANGLLLNIAYTRSKFLDNASEIFGSTSTNSNNTPQNTAVPSIFGGLTIDRSVSLFDRPNRVPITAVYELPFMRQQRGALGHIVGGWQVSGVYVMESGAPLNIYNGVNADGLGGNYDRPLYNPNGTPGVRAQVSTTSPTGYINPENNNAPISASSAMYIGLQTCTSTTTPCPGGNLGRFTARTPIQNNFDATLTKIVNLTERMHFEFRAEFYNLFNHRQYGNTSISPFDSGTTTIGADVANTTAGRFLSPGYADGGARVIRYQLKFIF